MIKTTRLKNTQIPRPITYDLTPQVDGETQTFLLPEPVRLYDVHHLLFNGQEYHNDANHTFYTISSDGLYLTTTFDEAPKPGVEHALQFVKTESEGDTAEMATKAYVDAKIAELMALINNNNEGNI